MSGSGTVLLFNSRSATVWSSAGCQIQKEVPATLEADWGSGLIWFYGLCPGGSAKFGVYLWPLRGMARFGGWVRKYGLTTFLSGPGRPDWGWGARKEVLVCLCRGPPRGGGGGGPGAALVWGPLLRGVCFLQPRVFPGKGVPGAGGLRRQGCVVSARDRWCTPV